MLGIPSSLDGVVSLAVPFDESAFGASSSLDSVVLLVAGLILSMDVETVEFCDSSGSKTCVISFFSVVPVAEIVVGLLPGLTVKSE